MNNDVSHDHDTFALEPTAAEAGDASVVQVDDAPTDHAPATPEPETSTDTAEVSDAAVNEPQVEQPTDTTDGQADETRASAAEVVAETPVQADAVAEAPVQTDAVESSTAPEATDAAPAATAPQSAPKAEGPRPRGARPRPGTPRPGPRPGSARPASAAELPTAAVSDPTPWGRVDADGSVYVKDTSAEGGERFVGSYPNATAAEALAYYGRKFDELSALADLAEQRMASPEANIKEITAGLAKLREDLSQAAVVGDLAGLAARLEGLEGGLAANREAQEKARAEAKAAAHARRLELVTEAEKISGTEAKRMQWKQSAERMTTLFEQWKTAQREDTKLDKPVEDELWHRFSHARTVFDRARRHHFSQLHAEHSQAKTAKEKLIAQAEALSSSTDWASTSNAYRDLLEEWKKAGRAGRKDDDALWARFRAAQDVFYAARGADNAKSDAELGANLEVKEKLLVEAEALLPITDVKSAKIAMRSIGERWDAAGKVPRADVQRIEKRLKVVEQAIREREDDRWRRSNPETKARTEGALGQLEAAIAGLEQDLAKAKADGNARRIADAESALAARRSWLEQIERTARTIR